MESNKKAIFIGIFLIASIVLSICAVWFVCTGLGSSNKAKYVMYFNESAKGLRKGAVVSFKGVPVGEVSEVNVLLNRDDFSAINQVIIILDRDRLKTGLPSTFKLSKKDLEEVWKIFVDKGLRAQLQLESIVTGVLMINLDYYPEAPALFQNREEDDDDGILEIPTKPSDLSQLSQSLGKIDIEELLGKITHIISSVEEATSGGELKKIMEDLGATLEEIKKVSANAESVVGKIDTNINPILDNIQLLTDNANKTFEELQGVAKGLNDATAKDSKFRYKLEKTIESINEASKSLTTLSDYLARHPNSVVFGKK